MLLDVGWVGCCSTRLMGRIRVFGGMPFWSDRNHMQHTLSRWVLCLLVQGAFPGTRYHSHRSGTCWHGAHTAPAGAFMKRSAVHGRLPSAVNRTPDERATGA